MTSDWSVLRHMTPCKKRCRVEERDFLLKDWVLLKIEGTNRTNQDRADKRFAIIAGDDLEALLEGIDASNTKNVQQQP